MRRKWAQCANFKVTFLHETKKFQPQPFASEIRLAEQSPNPCSDPTFDHMGGRDPTFSGISLQKVCVGEMARAGDRAAVCGE